MSSSCIVLICGLPATGKTTLIAKWVQFLGSVHVKKPAYITICYDDLIPLKRQEELVKLPDSWKKCRQEILEASEMFLLKMLGIAKLEPPIKRPILENIEKLNGNVTSGDVPQNFVLFVDDNFYYTSMRYSWYQLAKRLSVGFCQVYLVCPLAELCDRNGNREGEARLPLPVLQVMAGREERPRPQKNTWEEHSLLLENTKDHKKESSLEAVLQLIGLAMANPAKPEPIVENENVDYPANVINIIDRLSRKLVSTKILDAKTDGLNLAEYSKEINSVRQKVLENVRNGIIKIPASFEEDSYDHHAFVVEVFRNQEKNPSINESNIPD